MTKGFHKKQSRRVLAKRRYKIEKKVKEHHRKIKKEAKKNAFKKRKPKDPGVPNSLPFKEKVIGEMRSQKQKEKNNRQAMRNQLKQLAKTGKEGEFMKLCGVQQADRFQSIKDKIEAAAREQNRMVIDDGFGPSSSKSKVSNLKKYYKEFQKVIEDANVLIEVLDARDPLGTRCYEAEEALLKAGPDKRLILLLNKVDLVPNDNLLAWIKHLRQEFPTLAFKANTQRQSKLSAKKSSVLEVSQGALSSSKGFGAKELLSLLKNYCRNSGIKTSINVGVIGFPNVGKSSVINTLKAAKACQTGGVPGLTKVTQKVVLDKNIHLIDCPGIVYGNPTKTGDSTALALKNSLLDNQIEDSIKPIEAILARVKKDDLIFLYKIPDFSKVNDFLQKIAQRFGRLKKGGGLDINAASKKVLTDWNIGKIKYTTQPPEIHQMPSHISAEIVSKMSEGFNIDLLQSDDDMEAEEEEGEDEDDDEEDEEDEEDSEEEEMDDSDDE